MPFSFSIFCFTSEIYKTIICQPRAFDATTSAIVLPKCVSSRTRISYKLSRFGFNNKVVLLQILRQQLAGVLFVVLLARDEP
jgi:hypothetical protein